MKKNIIILILSISFIAFILMLKNTEDNKIELSDDGLLQGSLVISEVIAKNKSLYLDSYNEYYDIIEIYNPTKATIDLNGMGLSDDPQKPHLWTFKSGKVKSGEYLIVYAAGFDEKSSLHLNGHYTNFKLNADGEQVVLSDVNGEVLSMISYSSLGNDMSLSLIDGKYEYIYMGTPGVQNSGIIIEDINDYNQKLEIQVSHKSGIYEQAFDLTVDVYDGYELRYTLDGSNPTKESILYDTAIHLDYSKLNPSNITNKQATFYKVDQIPDAYIHKATVVKARYFKNNIPYGESFVGTYFIWEEGHEKYSFDIVSLSTDPSNLYDPVSGIYVVGDRFEKQAPTNPDGGTPANYNQRGREWERDANIEFFTNVGEKVYEGGIGIRIFGGWSRANTKKSFKLFARKDYGEKSFDYPFFDNLLNHDGELIESFDKLLLRSGGNDGEYTLFRDPLADSLIDGMLDYQQYKQVILFLNGEYWGIYHLREHMDENYIASHFDVNAKDVNIVAYNPSGLENYAGNEDEVDRYKKFMTFVDEEDMSLDENYDYVHEMMDINNFIDYYITQIFINNVDWPSNNAKVWRYTGEDNSNVAGDGRYRFLLYDTEFSFGLYTGANAASHNYFEFLHADTDEIWPNPRWATSFYRNFMENDEFKESFLLKFTDLLNSRFDKELVLNRINDMKDLYKPEMEEYINRWNFWSLKDMKDWEVDQLYILREFTNKRASYLLNFAKKQYNLETIVKVGVESFDGGSIVFNDNFKLRFSDERQGTINTHIEDEVPLFTIIKEKDNVFNYYSDFNIKIRIIPDEGYRFVAWNIDGGDSNNDDLLITGDLNSKELMLDLQNNVKIKVMLEKIINN